MFFFCFKTVLFHKDFGALTSAEKFLLIIIDNKTFTFWKVIGWYKAFFCSEKMTPLLLIIAFNSFFSQKFRLYSSSRVFVILRFCRRNGGTKEQYYFESLRNGVTSYNTNAPLCLFVCQRFKEVVWALIEPLSVVNKPSKL